MTLDYAKRNTATILAATTASDADFKDFNITLSEAGIGMALENRKT